MQFWNVLHEACWKYRTQKRCKNRYLGTIAQLCRAESSQLRHMSTIGKKLVKQQYVLHMSSQYGELRPTSGWDRNGSLRHPSKFQRLSSLGSDIARHWASAKLCGVEQKAPPRFGRVAITLGIGPHSNCFTWSSLYAFHIELAIAYYMCDLTTLALWYSILTLTIGYYV